MCARVYGTLRGRGAPVHPHVLVGGEVSDDDARGAQRGALAEVSVDEEAEHRPRRGSYVALQQPCTTVHIAARGGSAQGLGRASLTTSACPAG